MSLNHDECDYGEHRVDEINYRMNKDFCPTLVVI